MSENKQNDCAAFKEVQKSYPPGEHLCVQYELQPDYTPASRDWVGLFQIGWTSSRDYYTFEWAPTPEGQKGIVKFAGRRLPPEDSHFYQFCYVSSNGRVRGASPPFQFTSSSLCKHNIDDFELVEVSEDSLMVLQQKGSVQEAEVQKELTSVRESMSNLELEKKELTQQMSVIEEERQQQSGLLKEKDQEIDELQRQLQDTNENVKRLNEKLARQKEENNTLLAVKHDEDAQRALLVSKLASKDEEIFQQGTIILTLTEELRDLKTQIEDLTKQATARGEEKDELCSEIERVMEELLDTKGRYAEVLEKVEQKTLECEQLALNVEEARGELEKAEKRLNEVQQELNIATENISELMGQRETGVVFEAPRQAPGPLPEPPTAPAAAPGTVDSTVYASLLEAFDNLQKYYDSVKRENQELQLKNDELTARITQCRDQYAELARENHELDKKHKTDVLQLQELQAQLEDFTQGCDTAVTELSTRKEEIKMKNNKISELEETLRVVQQEFDTFQDRHDTDIQQRTEAIDIMKATLDNKIEELTEAQHEVSKLRHANEVLKAQLEGLKSSAKPADRTCPVCSTKFPARMRQQDFENHVQGHFRS